MSTVGQIGRPALGGLVDAHCHLWDRRHVARAWPDAPPALQRSFTPDDLADACADSHVASVVLVEAGSSAEEAALLQANAGASPLIGAFIAYLDPFGATAPDEELDRHAGSPKFRGVRMRFEGRPAGDLIDPRVFRAARAVADRGLVLELLVTTEQLPSVRRLCAATAGLRGIIDHLAKPDLRDRSDAKPWRAHMRKIAAETELLVKVSMSPRTADIPWLVRRGAGGWSAEAVRPYITDLLEAFGPSRLTWGSDWPVGVLGGDYAIALAVVRTGLGAVDPETEARLFRETAAGFYRLEGILSTVNNGL